MVSQQHTKYQRDKLERQLTIYLNYLKGMITKVKESKKFILYLIRWQLSSPILYLCLQFLNLGTLWNTIIANLIGRYHILLGR